jgi:hypothetical protein
MALNVKKYIAVIWTKVADAAVRAALREQNDTLLKLVRDLNAGALGSGTPQFGIILWDQSTSCPTGYTVATEYEGVFPRGTPAGGTVGATGGSDTHTHGTGGTGTGAGSTSTTGSTSAGTNMKDGTGTTITLSNFPHNHNISQATTLPPYRQVLFCRKD